MTGREAQCRRAKYVETGRLAGSVAGASSGGKYGAKVGQSFCRIAFVVATKGRAELACGIIGGAAGGYAGGVLAGDGGALLGGEIIEADGHFIFQPEGA